MRCLQVRVVLLLSLTLPLWGADPAEKTARHWMRSMTVRQKAAQLVFVAFYGKVPNSGADLYRSYERQVRELQVGGMALINRSEPYALAAFLNRMQRAARIPLLVAGDFERGNSMRVESDTRFPHNMAFAATGDPALSRAQGAITARQARALGVPWIYAPVADVNNNPDNPIINIRSYGEDPQTVAGHVRAYIEGVHSEAGPGQPRMLATVKHFPGHGDTSVDTHMALAVNPAPRERIESVELVPFRAAVEAGVDSIMSAHIAVPALDDGKTPATLSEPILTGVLKKELGFDGLVVTDALEMQGVARQWPAGEAAVKALEAGVDVLLLPADPAQAIDAVTAAVQRGRISKARLERSVLKVLTAKARLGLGKNRLVNIEALTDALDTPQDIAKAQEVAERAITLVKNTGNPVPLPASTSACFLVLTEGRGSQAGRAFAAEVRKRTAGAQVTVLDPAVSEAELTAAGERAAACPVTVVAAFASVVSYRGSVSLTGGYPQLLDRLTAGPNPVVLVALGNPYLLRRFPEVEGYLATYSTVDLSEIAAVRALFGEIPIQGRLPVSIPGLAQIGDGIQVPRAE